MMSEITCQAKGGAYHDGSHLLWRAAEVPNFVFGGGTALAARKPMSASRRSQLSAAMGEAHERSGAEEGEMPAKRQQTDDSTEAPSTPPADISPLDLGILAGQRIEVAWDVVMDDDSNEKVWWGGTIDQLVGHAPAAWAITYEARHGFEVEERQVIFCGERQLWDCKLRELLPWRPEGSTSDDEEDGEAGEEGGDLGTADGEEGLEVGAVVKARIDGSESFFSSVICAGTSQLPAGTPRGGQPVFTCKSAATRHSPRAHYPSHSVMNVLPTPALCSQR